MNAEKEKRIAVAAATAHDCLSIVKQLAVQNVSENFDEARKQAIAYAIARAKLYEAESKLNDEIRS